MYRFSSHQITKLIQIFKRSKSPNGPNYKFAFTKYKVFGYRTFQFTQGIQIPFLLVFHLVSLNTSNKNILVQIKDQSMHPYIKKGGFPFSDTVFYRKMWHQGNRYQNKIVAIKNPHKHNDIIIRRIIADENQWVQRLDDGGIIRIPNNHVWVECENQKERNLDSLSELKGPISKHFILGECKFVIWPIWRFTSFKDLYKFSNLMTTKLIHSRVYSSDEMFHLYGVR